MGIERIFSGLSQAILPDQDVSIEAARELLVVGYSIIAREASSKLVDRVASETFFGKKALPNAITLFSLIYAYQMELSVLRVHFMAVCTFYYLMSIWAWKSSNTAALPGYMVDMVAEAKSGAYILKIGYKEAVKSVEVSMKTKKNRMQFCSLIQVLVNRQFLRPLLTKLQLTNIPLVLLSTKQN
jgi:hypothetical protein